ncbi:DUF6082 family protein [Streptomyces sp. SID5789]|uniref:DUF6082 family protein n=1 Tax=Streptomyces sp. SID5789 TaxID=2690310 RepID=UPI001F2BFFBC|nr:DUF6082 family protein [Streptomyces sp. SID5789]
MLSLRDRLGFVRSGHLPWYAAQLMESDVCRRYWRRFGDLHAQEAEGDERAEHFTRVLDKAAKNHPQARPQQPDGTRHRLPDVLAQAVSSPATVWHQAPGPDRVPGSRTTHRH